MRYVMLLVAACFLGINSFQSFQVAGSQFRSGTNSRRCFSKASLKSSADETSEFSSTVVVNRPQNVNFAAPLLDYGYPPTVQDFRDGSLSEKPILLYLPGFDGTYICPFIQFPELGTEFDVWCMTVGMNDRSTFGELRAHVLDFIEQITSSREASLKDESTTEEEPTETGPFWSNLIPNSIGPTELVSSSKRRPIYLAGESFGGILASEVALSLLEYNKGRVAAEKYDLKGLTLINPATCYDHSALAHEGPFVYNLPSLRYPIGLGRLLPLFTDKFSVEQLLLILRAKALPSVIDTPARESYMGRVAFSLPMKLEYMNQGSLKWRLEEWLTCGCQRIQSRLEDFRSYPSLRTLIVVGECDGTLPSVTEADRLSKLLPRARVHIVEGAGHASTCGSRVDLTAELRRTFPELQSSDTTSKLGDTKRISMKPAAAKGTGAYLGMEERYDGASIGLNPIRYWSKDNFQRVKSSIEEVTTQSEEGVERSYKRARYSWDG